MLRYGGLNPVSIVVQVSALPQCYHSILQLRRCIRALRAIQGHDLISLDKTIGGKLYIRLNLPDDRKRNINVLNLYPYLKKKPNNNYAEVDRILESMNPATCLSLLAHPVSMVLINSLGSKISQFLSPYKSTGQQTLRTVGQKRPSGISLRTGNCETFGEAFALNTNIPARFPDNVSVAICICNQRERQNQIQLTEDKKKERPVRASGVNLEIQSGRPF